MTTTEESKQKFEADLVEILGDDPITLTGFLLNISMPSEARLQQRISKHQIEELKTLIQSANVRDISFSFFDNVYSNRIKAIRRDLYTKIITEFCIKIQHIGNKPLYLLPAENIEKFLEKTEELNTRLATLKRQIIQAQKELDNNTELQEILDQYNIKIKKVNVSGFKIFLQLDPIKISDSIVSEFISEKILDKYLDQLQERNKQIISSLEQDFLTSLKLLLTKLGRKIAGEKLHYQTLDSDLHILENKSSSVGLEHLSNLVGTVRTFLEQINEKEESSLEACAQEISELVRIPESENPKATIQVGLNKLNGVVDSRILSLQKKMLEGGSID